MKQNSIIDPKTRELREAEELIERGVRFTVPKKSILKYFGSKERAFKIRSPYAGVLDRITEQALRIGFDDMALRQISEADEKNNTMETLKETKRITGEALLPLCRMIAYAVLDTRWAIDLFGEMLARYFFWRMDGRKIFQLSVIINQMCDYTNFMNSIRLMSAIRTTAPNLVEEKQPA